MAKPRITDQSVTQHIVILSDIKGESTERSRRQSNNKMHCIHMYFVLQSLVTRNRLFQSKMYQIVQMWNKKTVIARLVIGRKNTLCKVKPETEGY